MSLDVALSSEGTPVTQVSELEGWFRRAERGDGKLLLGLEHEKLLYQADSSLPVAYPGARGIGALLEGFERFGFQLIRDGGEGGPVIAVQRGKETITLEPGGQFELAGLPYPTARECHAENLRHLTELASLCRKLGLGVAFLGYRPFGRIDRMPWMPKSRYDAMRRTLTGTGALHMMLMTATGQVSLDWRNEADCARKTTAVARVSPILLALYANSPITDGKLNGYLSFRSQIWTQTDPTRTGYPACIVDGNLTYARYTDWALDAPMLFLRRGGRYLTPPLTFRGYLAQGFEGHRATLSDWTDHLSTIFPEVRLKNIIEVRAADCVDPAMTGALGALMRGILYDDTALGEILALLPYKSLEDHRELHAAAQRSALAAKTTQGTSLADLAKEVIAISKAGLVRIENSSKGDAKLLEPLEEIAESGHCPAERVLSEFKRGLSGADFLREFGLVKPGTEDAF